MNAALGLSQLRELGRFLGQRREIGALFLQAVSRTVHRPLVPKGEGDYCFFSFPVLLEHGLREVRQYAQKKEIETRPAYAGSILERAAGARDMAGAGGPAGAEAQAAEGPVNAAAPGAPAAPPAEQAAPAALPTPIGETPEARNLLLRCLLFPLYPSLGRRNVDTISKVLMTLP